MLQCDGRSRCARCTAVECPCTYSTIELLLKDDLRRELSSIREAIRRRIRVLDAIPSSTYASGIVASLQRGVPVEELSTDLQNSQDDSMDEASVVGPKILGSRGPATETFSESKVHGEGLMLGTSLALGTTPSDGIGRAEIETSRSQGLFHDGDHIRQYPHAHRERIVT